MNKAQLDNIKNLTKDMRWKDVEEMLRDEISEMLDIKNIDKSKDIEQQYYGRLEYANTLIKFLRKTKMLSNDPIQIQPKNYR